MRTFFPRIINDLPFKSSFVYSVVTLFLLYHEKLLSSFMKSAIQNEGWKNIKEDIRK